MNVQILSICSPFGLCVWTYLRPWGEDLHIYFLHCFHSVGPKVNVDWTMRFVHRVGAPPPSMDAPAPPAPPAPPGEPRRPSLLPPPRSPSDSGFQSSDVYVSSFLVSQTIFFFVEIHGFWRQSLALSARLFVLCAFCGLTAWLSEVDTCAFFAQWTTSPPA